MGPQRGREDTASVALGRLDLTCTACARPFTLTRRVYEQRQRRYADAAVCSRCITDRWLRGAGRAHAARFLADDPGAPQGP